MLKLVHVLDMNYKSVVNYDRSYLKTPSFACYAVVISRSGIKEYYEYVKKYNPNMYYLIDDTNPDYILGYGDILNDPDIDYHLPDYNIGNISYDIRPKERGKGYGNAILKLLLEKCEELGMEDICISCDEDNIRSKKVIEKNNGIFEKEFEGCFGHKKHLKYWIKLKHKVKKKDK